MEKIEFTYASRSEHNIAQRLIIQTIEFYFNVNGIYIDNSIILEVTYASFIILIVSILPDITWGFFVFVKETSIQLNKIKSYKFK